MDVRAGRDPRRDVPQRLRRWRTFRRAFPFDAALLRPTGNEISLCINENAPPELGNELAYDALKLELDR